MRLFVAIELPERVRTAVDDLASRLRSRLPSAHWVDSGHLHLTLAFLGEVDEPRLPRLAAALKSVTAGARPFRLQIQGSGCFPASGRARVAWLGFGPCPEILELERSLATALQAALALEPERRVFRPHLTVARCSPPWPGTAALSWTGALAGELGESFPVGHVALMKSRLAAGGARYSTVHRFALGMAT